MKPIESLKARLSNDKLLVQNEKGFLSTVGFEWNPAATDKEISRYCKKVDGYYVSPGVFLLSNTRLITISAAENTAVDFCLPEKNR